MKSALGFHLYVLRSCAFKWHVLVAFLLGMAGPAQADPSEAATRSAARKIALDGIAALQRGDTDQATEKLEKAYRVLQVPSVALWSARALVKRGLLVEASERYQEASRLGVQQGEKAIQLQARKDAAIELEALIPRIPTLLVKVEGARQAEVSVRLDGAELPVALLGEERPVNPGEHRVVGRTPGENAEESVTLSEGDKKSVTLRFTPQPVVAAKVAAPPMVSQPLSEEPADSPGLSSRKVLSYTALGVGGAGLILGGVSGFLALRERKALDDSGNCRNDRCLQIMEDDVNGFRKLRTVSTVGFVAGGALLASGLVLVFTSASQEAEARQSTGLTFTVTPGSASVAGRF